MKKALIPMTILATLATPGIARANPSTASATCQGGIVYEGHDYPTQSPPKNTVTAYWDGVVVSGFPKPFSGQTSGTVPNPNKTSGHTWAVVWDRYNGTDGDRTQSGTVAACQTPPPTTTVASSTTVVTTTTASPTTSVPDVATTVVTDPTTTIVAVDIPPVPTTVALDVVSLTPAEPVLPRTGLDGTIVLVAAILVIGGVFLVLRGRRVQ